MKSGSFKLAGVAALFFASVAKATPVTTVVIDDPHTEGSTGSGSNFVQASATDLVNQGQPTLSGATSANFSSYNGSSPSVLNDGTNGDFSTNAAQTAIDTTGVPWSITYALNTGVGGSALGYDITGVSVSSLWNNDYTAQNYTVAVETTASPTAFTTIDTVTATDTTSTMPDGTPNGSGSEIVSTTTGSGTGGLLASGVTAIQFTFSPEPYTNANYSTVDNLAGYRETDVFGTATVPEPTSICGLALAGGASLLRRRRRSA